MIFNLTVNCKSEDESDLTKVAGTVNRLLRITIKVCESVMFKVVSPVYNLLRMTIKSSSIP